METNIHLVIHNITSGLSALALIGIVFFIFSNKNRTATGLTIALTALAAATFIISHMIGVSVHDPIISKNILMFNLSMFFIGAFNVHAVIATAGELKKRKGFLFFVYASAILFVLYFIFNPDMFLLNSEPKMYFPNYYVPGELNFTRIIFMDFICVPYIFYKLIITYKKTLDFEEKNKLKYFLLIMTTGYGIGIVPNFLVYDIQIDPLWGVAFASVLAIPFVVGAVEHRLFNIRVIAKGAFWYSLAVIVVGTFIVLSNYLTGIVANIYPGFPSWVISLLSSFLVVTVGIVIWKRLRENDLLKYEFITTMTHKFRTPLTGIRWATENLSKVDLPENYKIQLGYIKSENAKLVELTNLLTNISRAEDSSYDYHLKKEDISVLAEEVLANLSEQIKAKNLSLEKNLKAGAFVRIDSVRTKFVLQVFLENAIHYTPQGGKISVFVFKKNGMIIFSVKDTGVGISKEDFSRLFTKFYRGDKARLADTEGVGVGLFISKEIISRHKGKIWAESEGEGMGSTFSFSLPIAG